MMKIMADLCASIVVVLGAAWVVRGVLSARGHPPVTAVGRRAWVFLALLSSVGAHALLAGLEVIAWRSIVVPVALLAGWLVLCRTMVRAQRPAAPQRMSPVALALAAASVLVCWVAVNPVGHGPDVAVAATTDATPATTPTSPAPTTSRSTPVATVHPAPTTDPVAQTGQPSGQLSGPSPEQLIGQPGTVSLTDGETPRIVMATRGAIVYMGDRGRLTANTGATSASGAVALGVEGSDLRAGNSEVAASGGLPRGTGAASGRAAPDPATGHENGTFTALTEKAAGSHGTSLSGFEDHSVSVEGDDQVVTYDDSNVFIDRKGLINANTGDTDSSGLNAVDVTGSTVRAGNSGDSEGVEAEESPAEEVAEEAASPATSFDENRLSSSRVAPAAGEDPDDAEETGAEEPAVNPGPGQAFGTVTDEGASTATGKNAFVVGADGFDDVSIRSRGRNDIVTYDDSNVTIGGEGKVNSQIGDSDTGGGVVMGIRDSDVRAGCEGDLCYSRSSGMALLAQLIAKSGVELTPREWRQLSSLVNQE